MAGKNTVVKEVAINQIFPDITNEVSSACTWNEGDYLIFDTVNYVCRAATSEGEAAYGLGIAVNNVTSGIVTSPYSTANDAAIAAGALSGPMFGVTAKFILATSSTIKPGDQMYLVPASGARYVMPIGSGAGSGTKAIGVYQGAAITTSAAAVEVEVLVGARYPNDTLKF